MSEDAKSPPRSGRSRFRDLAVLVLAPTWMTMILLASWPAQIRPAFLDPVGDSIRSGLARVSLAAGLAVFAGTEVRQREIAVAHCIVAFGWDDAGRRTQIHHPDPCPPVGFRFWPETYEQMLVHWTWQMDFEAVGWNTTAMADHFCHRLPDAAVVRVGVVLVRSFIDYESGARRIARRPLAMVPCRT